MRDYLYISLRERPELKEYAAEWFHSKYLKEKGITPVYLITDHTDFYERYGWEFLCMVQGDGESEMTRMYIHS